MKSVRIESYSGPYFSAFELNTERYSLSLRIQSKCWKMRTRTTPNTDTFYAVIILQKRQISKENMVITCRISSYMNEFLQQQHLDNKSKEKQTKNQYYCPYFIDRLTLFRMGFFGAAHGWRVGRGAKRSPCLKSATHILQ